MGKFEKTHIFANFCTFWTIFNHFEATSDFSNKIISIQGTVHVNIADNNGVTPLCLAIDRNKIEIAKLLVANGANPNFWVGNGESPLSRAIFEKSLEMVEFLVENGAKINALDGDGYLPFHDTVTTSGAKMMKYFLQIGAPLNLRNVDGNNAMEIALMTMNQHAVKMLILN